MACEPLRDTDPTQVGRYRLTARLGAGGMAVVYLGAAGDGRPVAVKVPRPELADDPGFRARFGREVAALTRVNGMCTVRVIEADTESPRPFMVTEYVTGPTLSEYIDQYGPVGPAMLYGLATGLAEALTAIHAAGLVHRDLKPSNVILARDGPKVLDFGIAQALDATWLTKAGIMVGSVGFMAPEQVTGRAGQAADVFAWAVTLGYAASGGLMPFGTGLTEAVLYRILHDEPDIAAVPGTLRPLVESALAKDPLRRPAARELLERLTNPARHDRDYHARTQAVLAQSWVATQASPVRQPPAHESLLLSAPPDVQRTGTGQPSAPRPRAGRGPVSRRTAAIGAPVIALIAVALAITVLTGHFPKPGRLTANQQGIATAAFATYPGQQPRGVFQVINRIVAVGDTIVAIGSQTSDGVVRQQFFVSADGGATWRLAPVQSPGGGQPPLGHPAARLGGGPAGWVAVGPQAIWTSRAGLSWTLAATHGITPQLPGDGIAVLTSTAGGFLAAGEGPAGSGQKQAVIWTSRDGLTWQRETAAQLGLAGPGETVQSISFATSRGDDTVISGPVAGGGVTHSGAWLSTDGGSAWTPVTVPIDHGAETAITGLAFDGSGMIAIRPGRTALGGADGVAYFSPNGLTWQYAGTIDAAGGWSPDVVKGSNNGFVVTGTTASGQIVAYTSTTTGGTWRPTGSLGDAAGESVASATIGSGGTVIAVGSTSGSKVSQQPVFLEATTTGSVRPVPLTDIPGAVIPELAVNGLAAAGGEQVAVGSADGYPAVWRQASGGSWTLVSPLSLVSADPGLSALTSVTHGPVGWLAVGVPGPVVFTSADGRTWQRAGGSIAQDLGGVSAAAAAGGPAGYVIAGTLVAPGGGTTADVWWSPDLNSWTRASDMNDTSGSNQVLAVAARPHGFVSVGSHGSDPAVWTTTDGRTWTTIVLALPAEASGAVLQQVAISGDHVVALGQEIKPDGTVPFAELSADGGASWQEAAFVPAGPDAAVTALTAGSGGFTAASQSGEPGQRDAAVWASGSGTTWTPVPVNGLGAGGTQQINALAWSGSDVSGIGSIITDQSQQTVILTLPAS